MVEYLYAKRFDYLMVWLLPSFAWLGFVLYLGKFFAREAYFILGLICLIVMIHKVYGLTKQGTWQKVVREALYFYLAAECIWSISGLYKTNRSVIDYAFYAFAVLVLNFFASFMMSWFISELNLRQPKKTP